jgi:ribosome-binding protein aMBF1 (putative translation factor)
MKCEICGHAVEEMLFCAFSREVLTMCGVCGHVAMNPEDFDYLVTLGDLLAMADHDSEQETPGPQAEEPTQETWRDRAPLL